MIITSEHKLPNSKSVVVELPNLALSKHLVPSKISVFTKQDKDTAIESKHVSLSVSCGSTRILVLQEAYFQTSNEVDLSDHRFRLNEGCDVALHLTNLGEIATFRIEVEYVPSYGAIIYQNTFTEFNRVAKEIYKAGVCTRLVLNFNKPVKGAELLSLFSRDSEESADNEWFDSLELGETEDNQYVLDFTDSELKYYANFLNMMELSVPKREDTEDELRLYVIAYGFPHK